jgi:hypothetical protein
VSKSMALLERCTCWLRRMLGILWRYRCFAYGCGSLSGLTIVMSLFVGLRGCRKLFGLSIYDTSLFICNECYEIIPCRHLLICPSSCAPKSDSTVNDRISDSFYTWRTPMHRSPCKLRLPVHILRNTNTPHPPGKKRLTVKLWTKEKKTFT